ncbi:TRAP transporter small permease [Albidovulum sediminicola]|uniref:TRAP transporter small permease protein n=1 Tax=Albidovulum sediminicola TaxID=2984331 RepID=A0ABT2Z3D2_9RHOB|nr:TRAP transporter small permease [Defluviimonas sp. WL0075]MCV2865525.1 TRAP transporter small permease [Defluviimonas sp. WL0075]
MVEQDRGAGILRGLLDRIYAAASVVAALCLVGILIVIVVQMCARWFSFTFPGSAEYAGYLMAAASFLAFASALNAGSHIRVGLALTALGRHRFWGELWCLVIASAASGYLAWYAVRLVYWSWKLKDISQGQDATPLWIVQVPMAFGACLLAVAFADNLIALLLTGRDNIREELADQSHAE